MADPKKLDRGGKGNYDRVQTPLPLPEENRGATPPFKSAHDGIGLQFIKFVFVTRCYGQFMLMKT